MRSAWVGLALLVLAAWLRLQGLDWDQGQHLHPDERFLTMVESAIRAPASVAGYFDTARSPLNPANHNYGFFVYGTLPLFLVRALAGALGMADYGHVHFVGRVVSAAFDLGSLLLVAWIARRWFGGRAALYAAALYAAAVLPIQSAHFFTVDTAAAFFTTLTLAFLLEVGRGGGLVAHLGFAVAFACALACRINLLVLAPFYPLAGLIGAGPRWRAILAVAGRGCLAALVIALVFRVLQPYAFAGPGFFDLALAPAFMSSMETIRGLATGEADYPPGVQWIGRTPVLFPARNLFWWGLGPGLAAAAAVALVLGVFRPRIGGAARDGAIGAARWIALFALLPFAYHSTQFVTTGRYFLPWIPAAAILAGRLLAAGESSRWRRMIALGVVASTALWALAFTAIYRRPHPRVEASEWIHAHIPAGSVLATEHWDDALPLALPGKDSRAYRIRELEHYHDDTPAKRADLIDRLVEADALVLSSNRLYRSIPRTPWRYPLGRRYYELLFAGELGFRLEVSITSYPRLGPLEIPDDEAEEAFTVYDHPKVLIFRKTDDFSRERVERLLGAVPLDGTVHVTPREASKLYRRWRPEDVPLPGEEAVRSAVDTQETSSLAATVRWLGGFALVTGVVFVLVSGPLARLPDRGLGAAHVIAWLLPGYAAWLSSALGFAGNDPAALRTGFVVVLLPLAVLAWMRRRRAGGLPLPPAREIVFTEAVFLGAFALFALIRALNPAIFWGEKPMDFAILNALFRSRTMPPADPWWAGESLNYYYFGHQLVAGFAALVGVPPSFAFNLAIATIGGLIALAAYLAARRFTGVAGGLAAAAAASLLGNLEGLRLWLASPGRPLDFHYFWATTRLWENSINEFPFWNLVFADLHSHVIAQPLSLAAIAFGTWWIALPDGSRPVARPVLFGLIAWVTGAIAVTSSWSAPVAFAAQAALIGTDAWHAPGRRRALAVGVLLWLALVVAARLLYEPYWAAYRSPAIGWGFETATAPLGAVIRYFGALWFALVPVLGFALMRGGARRTALVFGTIAVAVMVLATAWLRSPSAGAFLALAALGLAAWWRSDDEGVRVAAALTAVTGAIGVGTEILFVADRMNTVFKFYLESWLLLAVAAGIALPRAFRELDGPPRVLYAVALALVAALGFFTAVTGALGAVRHPFAESPRVTLDGWAYLERQRAEELAAFRWLQREVGGVPVVLEAQGPSYQDFGRVSMNTGLPTVVGWEWHLIQQGHPRVAYEERATDVRTIYETTDLALADRLLRKYGVAFVFVGALERRTYPQAGLAKFDDGTLLDVVFRDGQTTLYARPGAVDAARTWIEPAKVSAQGWTPPVGRLREARDVAVGADGSVWVADFGHRRIQRFDRELQPKAAFGREGDAPGDFRDPCGLAIADDGRIFVADTWNHRVQILDAEGTSLAQWHADFYGPRGIAIAADGTVVVSDTGHHQMVRLDPSGRVLGRFGAGRLASPIGVALNADGEVFVADPERREIVVFALDGRELRSWRVPFWSTGGIVEPYLAIGSDGVVWATDPSGKRVLRYDGAGKFLGIAEFSRSLGLPLGIALLDDRTVVVSDAGDDALVRGVAPVAKTTTPSARNASGKSSGASANLARPTGE